jgi:hypothetical protein
LAVCTPLNEPRRQKARWDPQPALTNSVRPRITTGHLDYRKIPRDFEAHFASPTTVTTAILPVNFIVQSFLSRYSRCIAKLARTIMTYVFAGADEDEIFSMHDLWFAMPIADSL